MPSMIKVQMKGTAKDRRLKFLESDITIQSCASLLINSIYNYELTLAFFALCPSSVAKGGRKKGVHFHMIQFCGCIKTRVLTARDCLVYLHELASMAPLASTYNVRTNITFRLPFRSIIVPFVGFYFLLRQL